MTDNQSLKEFLKEYSLVYANKTVCERLWKSKFKDLQLKSGAKTRSFKFNLKLQKER